MSFFSRRRAGAFTRRRPPWRTAALTLAAVAVLPAADLPAPGQLGIGDRLFPSLGNPGYDVTAYDIGLDYRGDNGAPLEAVTTITARATAPLERVNLDFTRGGVRSVAFDGRPAEYARHGDDLVVTLARPVEAGSPMRITVRHTSDPRGDGSEGGWVRTTDGVVMANQADAARRVFPCNDHPSDKALFTFRITTPHRLKAVANGLPIGRAERGRRITWEYRTVHPMATELAQVSIGRSAVVRRSGPGGLPLRDVVPEGDRAALEPWLAKTPGQVAWMESKVGRYPFETYGVLIADARTGFELETQTLSLFERELFRSPPAADRYIESLMVHELAHQWFGDSVSPRRWSDLWLNESHATWYEAMYAQEKADVSLSARMRRAYEKSDGWRAKGGPPAAPRAPEPGRKMSLFRPIVYDGSALVLYALRERIGHGAFERLERAWVARHRDGVAGTEDFTALASRVSGQDLSTFFREWLYASRTPPMPGHPDWRTRGVGSGGGDGGGDGGGGGKGGGRSG